MNQVAYIKQLLSAHNFWCDDYTIVPNPNKRGQSISYFIAGPSGQYIYIAKFFDFFKGIDIPSSININDFDNPELLIEQLAEADDFMDDFEAVSDLFYYQKRAFTRYVHVCSETDTCFPKMIASKENIVINRHFYGLIIEEAIAGITLEEYLKSLDNSINRTSFAVRFLIKMAAIVREMIALNIVHRDLSPDNIMITDNDFVVIDPGVVKIVNRNTTSFGYRIGKATYMSPEQYHGNSVSADFSSDLYSIGLMTYEIITNVNPLIPYLKEQSSHPHEKLIHRFDREVEDFYYSIVDDTPLNQKLLQIIKKLLQPDKKYRFDDISSLEEVLSTLREDT